MPFDFNQDMSLMLSDFGEPVTLESADDILYVSAVVDEYAENSTPLVSGDAKSAFSLTLPSASVPLVTPQWSAHVRGLTRPVLASVPDGSGMTTIWLGDPEEDLDAI